MWHLPLHDLVRSVAKRRVIYERARSRISVGMSQRKIPYYRYILEHLQTKSNLFQKCSYNVRL